MNLLLNSHMIHFLCLIIILTLLIVKSICLIKLTPFSSNLINFHSSQQRTRVIDKIHLPITQKKITKHFIIPLLQPNHKIPESNIIILKNQTLIIISQNPFCKFNFFKRGDSNSLTKWSQTRR